MNPDLILLIMTSRTASSIPIFRLLSRLEAFALVFFGAMSVFSRASNGDSLPFPVLSSEASIYSLPHTIITHEFKVEPGRVLVTDEPDPSLKVHWVSVNKSGGSSVNVRLDFQVFEDRSFPYTAGEWDLVREFGESLTKAAEGADKKSSSAESVTRQECVTVRLGYQVPVKRVKVEAGSSIESTLTSVTIDKPADRKTARATREFYLAMRPMWLGYPHPDETLFTMLLGLIEVRNGFDSWREWMSRVASAATATGPERQMSREEYASVLNAEENLHDLNRIIIRLAPIGLRATDRPSTETADLLRSLSRVDGIPVRYGREHPLVVDRTQRAMARISSSAMLVGGTARSIQGTGLGDQVDRIIRSLDVVMRVSKFLWALRDESDARGGMERFAGACREAARSMDDAISVLAAELGIDRRSGVTGVIVKSNLATLRFTLKSAESIDSANAAREVLSDLLYRIMAARRQMQALAALFEGLAKPLSRESEGPAALAGDVAPVLPEGLTVDISHDTMRIRPAQIATYEMIVTNRAAGEREVRIDQIVESGPGWHGQVSLKNFRLKGGQSQKVFYKVVAPFFGPMPENHHATLKIGWSDRPGAFFAPQFLTRMHMGGREAAEPLTPETMDTSHDGLWVSNDGADQLRLVPGGVVDYPIRVIHDGSPQRKVVVRLLTDPPKDWVVHIEPEEIAVRPGEEHHIFMRVSAPLYLKDSADAELLLGIGYEDMFERPDQIAYRKTHVFFEVNRSHPQINGDEIRTYYARANSATTMLIEVANPGNADDTFDLFLTEKPKEWYVHLGQSYVNVAAQREPRMVPLVVRPPLDALTGESSRLVMRAVSTRHPEIYHEQEITLVARGDLNIALRAESEQYLAPPGGEGEVIFIARNILDRPVAWTFAVSPRTTHPEWFSLPQIPVPLEPGQERAVRVHMSVDNNAAVDQVYPIEIMALDENGGQLVNAVSNVRVIAGHKIAMRAIWEGVQRSPGIVIVPIEVQNLGAADEVVGLMLAGKRRYWGRMTHQTLRLRPGARFETRLTIRIPQEAVPGQDALLTVKAQSLTDPRANDDLSIEVFPQKHGRTNASTYAQKVTY